MQAGSDADVIAAIATPAGQGGIGIVRVSGQTLSAFIEKIVGKRLSPRVATFSRFRGGDGETLDEGIALYFPAPQSYTGQDVLELHGHGGVAVLNMVLARCLGLGARPAEPGEFTKRAYLNGKLDLAQAESVADLIAASTGEAARGALRSLQGEFSEACEALVSALVQLRTHIEGAIDFPEEPLGVIPELSEALRQIQAKLGALLDRAQQGSLLREGFSVALLGEPNVGKSSLLNRLAAAEVAIVADSPGTTRDLIRERIQLKGVRIHLVDTAGLREPKEAVERAGVDRAWTEARKVDVILWVIDAARTRDNAPDPIVAKLPPNTSVIHVLNKIDLIGVQPRLVRDPSEVWVSAKTGAGINLLEQAVLEAAGWRAAGEGVFVARQRHLQSLLLAHECLERAAQHLPQPELAAEELRLAQKALTAIGGEFVADDLLGEIFSKFCIGK